MTDELKTLFKQSGTESIIDSPINQRATKIETVIHYHEQTKHNFNRYARSLGYLDWDTQPDPFRRYAGSPLLYLPFAEIDDTPGYSRLFEGQIESREITLETIGQFFELSLGLSAWKEFRGNRWALRVNPSSGNLHPTEGYVILGSLDSNESEKLGPMVCHYAPKEHCLELRRQFSLDVSEELMRPFPKGSFLIGLSSIHWREAWKYGERAFRYCQHDIGHALGALRISAGALGWRMVVLNDVGDEDVAKLLGLARDEDYINAEREHPDLLAVVIPSND